MHRAVALVVVVGLGACAGCKRWGEGAPDRLVSAEQSQAAAPKGWEGAGYAPDPPLGMLAQIFEEAGPVSRKLTIAGQSFIVCRAAIIDGTISLPLLGKTSTRWGHHIELRVGSMPSKQGTYGAHEGASFIGAPLARLSPGESITLKLVEQGLLPGKRSSDVLSLRFTGSMPIVAHAEYGDAECRAVGREVIEKRLPDALALADGRLRAGRASADAAQADFGLEVARSPRKERFDALAIPAGLVGWADPRLASRLASERAGGFEQQAAPLIQRAFATAAPASDWVAAGKLRFRRATATCGPTASRSRTSRPSRTRSTPTSAFGWRARMAASSPCAPSPSESTTRPTRLRRSHPSRRGRWSSRHAPSTSYPTPRRSQSS